MPFSANPSDPKVASKDWALEAFGNPANGYFRWLVESETHRASALRSFLERTLKDSTFEKRVIHDLKTRWESAYFEVVVLSALKGLGARIDYEVATETGRRPDYLASFDESSIIVECVAPETDRDFLAWNYTIDHVEQFVDSVGPPHLWIDIVSVPMHGPQDSLKPLHRALRELLARASETYGVHSAVIPLGLVKISSERKVSPSSGVFRRSAEITFGFESKERIVTAIKKKRSQVRGRPAILAVGLQGHCTLEDFDDVLFGTGGQFLRPGNEQSTFAGILAFRRVGCLEALEQPTLYIHPRGAPIPPQLLLLETRQASGDRIIKKSSEVALACAPSTPIHIEITSRLLEAGIAPSLFSQATQGTMLVDGAFSESITPMSSSKLSDIKTAAAIAGFATFCEALLMAEKTILVLGDRGLSIPVLIRWFGETAVRRLVDEGQLEFIYSPGVAMYQSQRTKSALKMRADTGVHIVEIVGSGDFTADVGHVIPKHVPGWSQIRAKSFCRAIESKVRVLPTKTLFERIQPTLFTKANALIGNLLPAPEASWRELDDQENNEAVRSLLGLCSALTTLESCQDSNADLMNCSGKSWENLMLTRQQGDSTTTLRKLGKTLEICGVPSLTELLKAGWYPGKLLKIRRDPRALEFRRLIRNLGPATTFPSEVVDGLRTAFGTPSRGEVIASSNFRVNVVVDQKGFQLSEAYVRDVLDPTAFVRAHLLGPGKK